MREEAQTFYNTTHTIIVIEHFEKNDKNEKLYVWGFDEESAMNCKVTFEELEEALRDLYNEYSE